MSIIKTKGMNFWDKRLDQDDFLNAKPIYFLSSNIAVLKDTPF